MARKVSITAEEKAKFIQSLQEEPNVTSAARAIGISRFWAYELKKKDAEFSAAWDQAIEEGVDQLEKEMWRRAVHGRDEPVFWQGQECGAVRKYSDTLAIVLAKAHRPEKYRERYAVDANVSGQVKLDASELSDDVLAAIAARAVKK